MVGEVLGHYRIVGEIGSGGAGVVYQAVISWPPYSSTQVQIRESSDQRERAAALRRGRGR